MFGTRKNKTPNAPEFWLPAEMRDRSEVAALRASRSPLTERGWHEFLEQLEFMSAGTTRVDILTDAYLTDAGEPHTADDARALSAEIMSDPERAWNAYVTIRAREDIAGIIAQEKVAAEAEKARIRYHRCSVCGLFDDDAPIGRVKVRDLPGGKAMFSCEVCHVVAAEHLRVLSAGERIDGGQTRAEAVAAYLKTGNLTRRDRSIAGLVASVSPNASRTRPGHERPSSIDYHRSGSTADTIVVRRGA